MESHIDPSQQSGFEMLQTSIFSKSKEFLEMVRTEKTTLADLAINHLLKQIHTKDEVDPHLRFYNQYFHSAMFIVLLSLYFFSC